MKGLTVTGMIGSHEPPVMRAMGHLLSVQMKRGTAGPAKAFKSLVKFRNMMKSDLDKEVSQLGTRMID
jgi:hypothetical protein